MARPASTNAIEILETVVIKHYGPKRPYARYYLRLALDWMGVRQPIEYQSARRRMEFEVRVLSVWRQFGCHAPEVLRTRNRTLDLSRLPGVPLQDLIAQLDGDALLEVLGEVVRDMSRRHALAMEHDQKLLCHVDANPGNLLIDHETVYHVDFEMGRERESLADWMGREVSKFIMGIVNRVPASRADDFLQLLVAEYQPRSVLQTLARSKSGSTNKSACNVSHRNRDSRTLSWRDVCRKLEGML